MKKLQLLILLLSYLQINAQTVYENAEAVYNKGINVSNKKKDLKTFSNKGKEEDYLLNIETCRKSMELFKKHTTSYTVKDIPCDKKKIKPEKEVMIIGVEAGSPSVKKDSLTFKKNCNPSFFATRTKNTLLIKQFSGRICVPIINEANGKFTKFFFEIPFYNYKEVYDFQILCVVSFFDKMYKTKNPRRGKNWVKNLNLKSTDDLDTKGKTVLVYEESLSDEYRNDKKKFKKDFKTNHKIAPTLKEINDLVLSDSTGKYLVLLKVNKDPQITETALFSVNEKEIYYLKQTTVAVSTLGTAFVLNDRKKINPKDIENLNESLGM